MYCDSSPGKDPCGGFENRVIMQTGREKKSLVVKALKRKEGNIFLRFLNIKVWKYEHLYGFHFGKTVQEASVN